MTMSSREEVVSTAVPFSLLLLKLLSMSLRYSSIPTCTLPHGREHCTAGSPKLYVNLRCQSLPQFLYLLCSQTNTNTDNNNINYCYYGHSSAAAHQTLTRSLVGFFDMLVCVRSCVRRRTLLRVDTRRYCRLKASVKVQFDNVQVTFAAFYAVWSPARHDRVPPRTAVCRNFSNLSLKWSLVRYKISTEYGSR